MPNHFPVPTGLLDRYDVREWRHGIAILSAAHPEEWRDILETLQAFRLLRSDIVKPGGRKSQVDDSSLQTVAAN